MALSAGSGELGPHLPGHRNSLRLLRPWATQWALWSTRELQRYSGYSAPSHPAKWWVLGRLHSSQASLRPAGIQLLYHFRVRKPSSCLGLCIPAMSPFLFWHHETSLAPPGKRTQTPLSLCGLCGISIPIPAQLGEVAGLWDLPLGTHQCLSSLSFCSNSPFILVWAMLSSLEGQQASLTSCPKLFQLRGGFGL